MERFHRTLNSMLAKVVTENQRNWCEKLPAVMAAYRSAKHDSTGFSPNFLVFGRENRAPVDLVLGPVLEEEVNCRRRTYGEFVDEQLQRYQEAYCLAREHLGAAAERRKVEYDAHVTGKDFRVGNWVWYFYPRRYAQRSPKWSQNYTGPYLIVKTIPPCDYVIQKSKRSTPIVVHGNKLKLCRGLTPDSWLRPETATDIEDDRAGRNDTDMQPGTSEGYIENVSSGADKPARRRLSCPSDGDRLEEFCEVRPKRQKKSPKWLEDYQF